MRLIESLATTEALSILFADESIVGAMLEVEAALARAQARVGVIPNSAAEAIATAVQFGSPGFVVADLARDTQRAGTPTIPLVKALTERVQAIDPSAAGFVHWGATSQDISDTALVVLLKRARAPLSSDHERLDQALKRLSEKHRDTVMLGRTLLQPAPPVTFGLKAARWRAAARRGWKRLDAALEQALVVQFGGASGTLASLGKDGLAVAQAFAEELGLECPDAPWHAERDRLAALVSACGIYTASLGKMARDVALLMQSEIGEASEPGGAGRGGSSSMPQKRNAIACSLALAAAARVPGLVASFLSSMTQEHERAVGGVQSEWPVVAGVIQAAGLAAASMTEAAEGLEVNAERMRANIDATRGAVFAERAMMMLAPKLGRDAAYKLVEAAARRSALEGVTLSAALAAIPEVADLIPAASLRELDRPESYLGSAETFRARLNASE